MSSGAHVVLLGAGVVGRAAACYVAGLSGVASLTIADRDPAAAAAALAGAGGRGRAVAVDVRDHDALVAVAGLGDVVLNCVGPFFRFGPGILAAVLAAGRPYLDICDDPEPTLTMLAADDAARRAGVTAVVGQGASPGTSNLLAMRCVSDLGGCNSLITGWSLDDDPGVPESAANEHWIEQATARIPVWRDGALRREEALREIDVALPGFLPRPALTIGHPEAVTLPRLLTGLVTCLNVMTLPASLAETLRRAARAVHTEGAAPAEACRRELARHVPGALPELPEYPGVWALAQGNAGSVGAYLRDYGNMTDMATTTAAPLVAGLSLLLAGKAARHGVLTPEEAFSPRDYFTTLAGIAGVDGEIVQMVRA